MTIILTRGVPGSGKSTWAKQFAEETGAVRVNMDDIRHMVGLPYSKESEEIALKIQDQAILAAVKAGKNVVVDNTHIEKKMPTRYKKLFDGEQPFMLKDFTHVPLDVCIMRDKNGDRNVPGQPSRTVGSEVIGRMYNRLKKVELTEAWLNDVKLSPLYKPVPGSAAAVVFDIDGTLAEHVARSPYDYSRVLTDKVIGSVANLAYLYAEDGYEIIIMSGRPDIDNVRVETETWLRQNFISYHHFFMRPADMLKENDADVKQHLFDKYVRDEYRVHMWFDDRDRVVRRLRKLGIKVAQVAEGDF